MNLILLVTLTILATLCVGGGQTGGAILVSAFYQAQRKLKMLLTTSQSEVLHPQEEINQ